LDNKAGVRFYKSFTIRGQWNLNSTIANGNSQPVSRFFSELPLKTIFYRLRGQKFSNMVEGISDKVFRIKKGHAD
jgi:hypothetical protein